MNTSNEVPNKPTTLINCAIDVTSGSDSSIALSRKGESNGRNLHRGG